MQNVFVIACVCTVDRRSYSFLFYRTGACVYHRVVVLHKRLENRLSGKKNNPEKIMINWIPFCAARECCNVSLFLGDILCAYEFIFTYSSIYYPLSVQFRFCAYLSHTLCVLSTTLIRKNLRENPTPSFSYIHTTPARVIYTFTRVCTFVATRIEYVYKYLHRIKISINKKIIHI